MNWRLISSLMTLLVAGCAATVVHVAEPMGGTWGGPGRFVGPVPGHPAGAWPYRRIET